MEKQKNELAFDAFVDGIEKKVNEYSSRFVTQTQRLLDEKATASYHFVDATLNFNNGKMAYTHTTVFSLKQVKNPTETIPVKTAQEAFEYIKNEIVGAELFEDDYSKGIADLEKFCQN